MCIQLSDFGDEKYIILKLLYDNQINVKDDCYVSLSQQEIADMVHFSKLKTNRIINELKTIDCISQFQDKKGKYVLTEKGKKVLQLMQVTL